MTAVELTKYFDSVVGRMRKILVAKNHDYGGKSLDAFSNFTRVEALGIASAEQGFLTRMTDKMCRIANFIQQGVLKVDDEKIEDTLLDLANYAILMAAYIKSKKEEK